MADEQTVEQKATSMGWVPKEEFRGDEKRWMTAEDFVERGESFIPFLKKSNGELKNQINTISERNAELERLLRANTAAIEEMQEENTERNKEAVVASRDELIDQIAAARQAGDTRQELLLMDKLSDTREQLREAAKKPEVKAENTSTAVVSPAVDYTKTPEWQTFKSENSWFDEDPVMRSASIAIGQQLAAEGGADWKALGASERFSRIAAATRKRFGMADNARRQGASKVEGGRSSGGNSGGSGGSSRGYDSLPREAQEACDRAGQRLIGNGKKYKTQAEQRTAYARTYFAE